MFRESTIPELPALRALTEKTKRLAMPDAGKKAVAAWSQVGHDELQVAETQMPKAGLEPARLAAPPPQDGVSANSTTSAKAISSPA